MSFGLPLCLSLCGFWSVNFGGLTCITRTQKDYFSKNLCLCSSEEKSIAYNWDSVRISKWQSIDSWIEHPFKEILLVIIFFPSGYSIVSWSLLANGKTFHPHSNQQTHSNQRRLSSDWLLHAALLYVRKIILTFSMLSCLFTLRFHLATQNKCKKPLQRLQSLTSIKAIITQVWYCFYTAVPKNKLLSSNWPFRNTIVRYLVYFCCDSKKSSVQLEHRKE